MKNTHFRFSSKNDMHKSTLYLVYVSNILNDIAIDNSFAIYILDTRNDIQANSNSRKTRTDFGSFYVNI